MSEGRVGHLLTVVEEEGVVPRSALGRTEGRVVWLVMEERRKNSVAGRLRAANLFQAGRRDLIQ